MSSAAMVPIQRRISTPAPSLVRETNEISSTTEYLGSATLLARIFRIELEKPRLRMSRSSYSFGAYDDELEPRRDTVFTMNFADIYPHQYTEDPTVAWEMLKAKRPVKTVRQMKLDAPIKPDHVRFVCVACTHGVPLDPASIPPGDILIVAGDFTSCGLPKEVKAFNENMGQCRCTSKQFRIGQNASLIPGKDLGVAKEVALKQALSAALSAAKVSNPRSLLTNVIYLQDSMVELFGIRIYGTPWQPKMDNWAFNLPRGQPLLTKWNQIPTGVDVLITHSPPLGKFYFTGCGEKKSRHTAI
ncbi:unnamed protein product [Toxocara canis]|uniref:Pyr_redox_2 domain-containing protein n=1 Tax=Toxocara canis TaxID=6265 RepID=A0A183URP2_TOXCA|nr:unnamed protein product [Toxocara canis]